MRVREYNRFKPGDTVWYLEPEIEGEDLLVTIVKYLGTGLFLARDSQGVNHKFHEDTLCHRYGF